MLLLALACTSPEPADGSPAPTDAPAPTDDTGTSPTTPPATGDTGTSPGTADTGATIPTADTGPAPPERLLQFGGPPPTNLLIVSLDTTRRDRLGWFSGNGRTPNLDAVLAESVVLERHRSCSSWTAPSMTCVTTGLTPFELDFFPWSEDQDIRGADPRLPTLAIQLKNQRGFATTLVTGNNVFDFGLNFTIGFDTVERPWWLPAERIANAGLDEARALLRQPDPWYLHVHFIDPHGTYCPPDDFVETGPNGYVEVPGYNLCIQAYGVATDEYFDMTPFQQDLFVRNLDALYDAEIEYWDSEFGRFWAELDAMGALDDTLVMFVTDHGQQHMERGGHGHGITLGAEENRSTAAFWAKDIVPVRWTENTVHQDLTATLFDHFGVTPPTPSSGTVVGLAPPDRALTGMLYWDVGEMRLSVVKGDTQLLYDWTGEKHFYDHAVDDAGLTDQYDATDPRVIDLWTDLERYADEVRAAWPSVGAPVDLGP